MAKELRHPPKSICTGLALGTAALVAGVLLHYQLTVDNKWVSAGEGHAWYGWPYYHLHVAATVKTNYQPEYHWAFPRLAANIVVNSSLVGATAFAVRHFSGHMTWPPRFRLRTLLGLAAICAILLSIRRATRTLFFNLQLQLGIVWEFGREPWYMQCCYNLAFACSLYVAAILLARSTRSACQFLGIGRGNQPTASP
jgi:hypothetical protein